MSSRPLLRPETVASALSMTTSSTTSNPSNINMVSAVGYTITWGAGSLGEFTVEVSNDYNPSPLGVNYKPLNTGTWVPVTLSTSVVSAGTASSAYIDVVGISAAWIRAKFTHASSTGGTWTAVVAGKVQ